MTLELDGSSPANTAAIRIDVIPESIDRYFGGGYTVMQQMIEDISEESFATYIASLMPSLPQAHTYQTS